MSLSVRFSVRQQKENKMNKNQHRWFRYRITLAIENDESINTLEDVAICYVVAWKGTEIDIRGEAYKIIEEIQEQVDLDRNH